MKNFNKKKVVIVSATLVVAVIISIVLGINIYFISKLSHELNTCETNMTELYNEINDLNTEMNKTNKKIQKVSDKLTK